MSSVSSPRTSFVFSVSQLAGWYCAYTPDFEVRGYGDNPDAAKDQMCEAAQLTSKFIVAKALNGRVGLTNEDLGRFDKAQTLLNHQGSISYLFATQA